LSFVVIDNDGGPVNKNAVCVCLRIVMSIVISTYTWCLCRHWRRLVSYTNRWWSPFILYGLAVMKLSRMIFVLQIRLIRTLYYRKALSHSCLNGCNFWSVLLYLFWFICFSYVLFIKMIFYICLENIFWYIQQVDLFP